MTHIDGGINGTLRAETKDDQSAENLRQVVQGLLALGRMQNDPKATAIMNSLQLSGSGQTVKLSFSVPSEVLDMLPIKKDMEGGHHLRRADRICTRHPMRRSHRRLRFRRRRISKPPLVHELILEGPLRRSGSSSVQLSTPNVPTPRLHELSELPIATRNSATPNSTSGPGVRFVLICPFRG